MAAGIEGINLKIEPPQIELGNTYNKDSKEMILAPKNLSESADYFEKSEFVQNIFGKDYQNCLVLLARHEWDKYEQEVSNWEIKRYLDLV